jgi:hypothetical protein
MLSDDMNEAIEILKETRAELCALPAITSERLAPSSPSLGGHADFHDGVHDILRSTWVDLLELAELEGRSPND